MDIDLIRLGQRLDRNRRALSLRRRYSAGQYRGLDQLENTTEALILRRDPGSSIGSTDRSTEFELLRAAGDAGVPVPAVRFLLEPDDGLGDGFVMARIDGETIPRKLLRDDEYADARPQLTAAVATAAAAIHAVPVDALPRLARGDVPMLIGTDCPAIDANYLASASSALDTHDAVFGPVEDGGYALVGVARDVDAYAGIAWSTPSVMAGTRAALRRSGARWMELPTLWDVDNAEDLARWRATGPRAA